MTQIFDEKGVVHACTIVTISPVVVTQIKNIETDGYISIQVGAFPRKKDFNKPLMGHLKELGNLTVIQEVRTSNNADFKVGDTIPLSNFAVGDIIEVTGTSKGKGFQGVIKRHGFHGGPRTHGNAHAENEPGSISGGLRTHVPKGMRMGGRMGSDRTTVTNLRVLGVDTENNTMLIKGAVPGRRGTLLEIKG